MKIQQGGANSLIIYGEFSILEWSALAHWLRDNFRQIGVIDAVAAPESVYVQFDPVRIDVFTLRRKIRHWQPVASARLASTQHVLPVCYDPAFAPDLYEVCRQLKVSSDQLINWHSNQIFTVEAIGFAPGFAYLSGVPDTFQLPRRMRPRTRVPPGSVALAERWSAVYPQASPAGWHIIGICPMPLFQRSAEPPVMLNVGDTVRFTPCTISEVRQWLP
ncbi:allophanate hydrolase subunit 1 [Bowmanella sp. JS7-9]|uniref:5-oxoprolinase subunit B family protein n=1 Tax=Alteromonadaceae TaxID=72275 RepID=UPI001039DD9E|nr:allophanate hydrolase subunit 1 [Bowmanella sp. JS7-9]